MLTDSFNSLKTFNMNHIIMELENSLFVNRDEAILYFHDFIKLSDYYSKILHIYGPAGSGKTFLLNEFSRIAREKELYYFSYNCEEHPENPKQFLTLFISFIHSNINEYPYEFNNDSSYESLLVYCLKLLSYLNKKKQVIISIDCYSYLNKIDNWFREVFIREIDQNTLIVLASRKPFTGDWKKSPIWKRMTKEMKLDYFSLKETRLFLSWFGISNDDEIDYLWRLTDGHPLMLSLSTSLIKGETNFYSNKTMEPKLLEVMIYLNGIWLKEVEKRELVPVIEIISFFNTFNQSSLSAILNKDVSDDLFNELISLSFIYPVTGGWSMDKLLRDSLLIELKQRNPSYFYLIKDRMIMYYYKRVIATRTPYNISQLFYYSGDSFIQSVFFKKNVNDKMSLECVTEGNFAEVAHYIKERQLKSDNTNVSFYHRLNNDVFSYNFQGDFYKKEYNFITPKYIKKMNIYSTKLLKNEQNDILGLSIIIPVNEKTLPELRREPISKSYFLNVGKEESDDYNVPVNKTFTYFIRLIDIQHSNESTWSYLLYRLFTYINSGNKIIVSTPIPFFQTILEKFRFKKIDKATHDNYGESLPSYTYLLDLTGDRFAIYLREFTQSVDEKNQIQFITEVFSFTKREMEIVMLILEGKRNLDIAKELFIAEVTVKKHITRILQKVDVKNRTQLIKKIMKKV